MSQRRQNVISKSKSTRHGHVFYPPSRAYLAWLAGDLDDGALNQRESGKFFPLTLGDQPDAYAPQDQRNSPPPPDGKIASANQRTGQMLDAPGSHWQKHQVRGAQTLDVSWHFTANHVTRRWNYFITREGWNPSQALSREQFEETPFYTVQINLKPFWEHSDAMKPPSPTTHQVPLPRREGYQVLLAIWEVADTSNAFYQVVDLDFLPDDGGGERPTTPTGLKATQVTDQKVVLEWNPSTGPTPIAFYRITRNGISTIDVDAPLLTWTDTGVAPETLYQYFICAVDEAGNISSPSRAIEVRTPAPGGEDAPPSAPTNLHSMGQTARSVSLMWSASSGPSAIANYLVFRDGNEIKRVSGAQTSGEDVGLTPGTEYRYSVKALDLSGRMSASSNVLTVKTQAEGEYPEWALDTQYAANARVSYNGGLWRCLQAHTSYTADWAPGKPGSEVLWESVTAR